MAIAVAVAIMCHEANILFRVILLTVKLQCLWLAYF